MSIGISAETQPGEIGMCITSFIFEHLTVFGSGNTLRDIKEI